LTLQKSSLQRCFGLKWRGDKTLAFLCSMKRKETIALVFQRCFALSGSGGKTLAFLRCMKLYLYAENISENIHETAPQRRKHRVTFKCW